MIFCTSDMPSIILVDNGSRRADATRSLRRIAARLALRLQQPVYPVSLQHADAVPAAELDGTPANTFGTFLDQRLRAGDREFLLVPLFFGVSRALTRFIPDTVDAVGAGFGSVDVQVAEVLCPLPAGDPRLVDILKGNLEAASPDAGQDVDAVVLVDHGSPLPEVSAVRHWLAGGLTTRLGATTPVLEAVMERRADRRYDFNGDLLEDVLERLATEGRQRGRSAITVALAMQFISPGRHAGPGGDIEQICGAVRARHPLLDIRQSALVGEHPALIDILEARVRDAMAPA